MQAATLVPAGRSWQVPGTAAQSPQGPQALSQHAPLAQKFDRQALPPVQAAPTSAGGWHWLPTQRIGPRHCGFDVHATGQLALVPLHR